jgi:hypothetical protein
MAIAVTLISATGCSIVDSGGEVCAVKGNPSNPITARS